MKDQLGHLVRQSVEGTLNEMLDAEADQLCQAQRYERTDARRDTRAGHYQRKLHTKAGEVKLDVPKLRKSTFETAIIERYKRLQMVVHDFDPQYSNYTEKLGYLIETQVAYKDVSPAEYDGLVIPGGRGPEEIRQYDEVLRIVGYFMDKRLPLGAMCHGPQVIYAARPIKGRRLAAYHGIRADVELAQGVFVDEPVVV